MELEGRIALITGASSGIGEVIARFYLNEGAYVYGCGLEAEANIQHERFAYHQANICDETQAAQVAAACKEHFGGMVFL